MTTLLNPATEEVIGQIPSTSPDETEAVIARSAAAFGVWRSIAPGDRTRLLRRFAEAVDADVEHLAQLEVSNSGHPIRNARWEAENVRDTLHYFAATPERLTGHQIPVPGGVNITFHEPLGVVAVIVPWNFPMPIAAWGFAPALAAGNTVIVKPAELTPLTALRLSKLALEAGIPAGVFQVVTGPGHVVGYRLVTHPAVRKVVFTGSTEIGKQIMAECAPEVKRFTLELGGKSANIVFDDADLEQAAATAPYAVFDNAGQDCCARSRILVQASIYDQFMALFEPAVRRLVVGDPRAEETEIGPLISAQHQKRVATYLEGAPIAFQRECPGAPGFWFSPTVVTPTRLDDALLTDEIFGPVVAVVTFTDEADAIALANRTDYGLSGSIWTSDVGRALRVARGVEAGNLSVNSHTSVRYWTPFGGFKQSGFGRELGPDAADAFTETKNVFISTGR
jgi:acyl-CoA reductase-like NAD-dependent aldehyde dehydrogenase